MKSVTTFLAVGLLGLAVPEPEPAAPARKRLKRIVRLVAALAAALVLVVGIGYTAYVGAVGSDQLVHPTGNPDCRTPLVRYGWTYEAINYDIADDAVLRNANPNMEDCSSQGATAGTEVVTSRRRPHRRLVHPGGQRHRRHGSDRRARPRICRQQERGAQVRGAVPRHVQRRRHRPPRRRPKLEERGDVRTAREARPRGDHRLARAHQASGPHRRDGQLDGRRSGGAGGRERPAHRGADPRLHACARRGPGRPAPGGRRGASVPSGHAGDPAWDLASHRAEPDGRQPDRLSSRPWVTDRCC